MTTLREDLNKTIKEADEARRMFGWVEENYPELLDIECKAVITYAFGYITFMGRRGTKGLASQVARALNVEDSFEKDLRDGREYTKHKVPAEPFKFKTMTIETAVPTEEGCKRYRVVREYDIELCGDINESNYLSVEEIE